MRPHRLPNNVPHIWRTTTTILIRIVPASACFSYNLGFLVGFISTSRRCLNAAAATTRTNNLLLLRPHSIAIVLAGWTDTRITAAGQPSATYILAAALLCPDTQTEERRRRATLEDEERPARIMCGFKARVARFLIVDPTLWNHIEVNLLESLSRKP